MYKPFSEVDHAAFLTWERVVSYSKILYLESIFRMKFFNNLVHYTVYIEQYYYRRQVARALKGAHPWLDTHWSLQQLEVAQLLVCRQISQPWIRCGCSVTAEPRRTFEVAGGRGRSGRGEAGDKRAFTLRNYQYSSGIKTHPALHNPTSLQGT